MKKYLAILAVLFTAILSSCSNDDIPVSQSTTFTIAPTTVIEQLLAYEVNAGDLEVLPQGWKLHVQLLIYNSTGKLIKHEEELLQNYTDLMKRELYLPSGDYNALAITSVEAPGVNYWEFDGLDKLSGATIVSSDYIGYQYKILGLQSGHFTVEDGEAKEFRMTPRAFGALFVILYNHINRFNDITSLGLATNRTSNKLVFNSIGNPTLTINSHDNMYDWWNNVISPADETSANVYAYSFQLPISNYGIRFEAYTSNQSNPIQLSKTWNIDIKAGDGYIFRIDLDDNGEITANSTLDIDKAQLDASDLDNKRTYTSPSTVHLSAIRPVELHNYKRTEQKL